MRRAAVTASLVAAVLGCTGCVAQAPASRPLTIALSAIQSHTIRLHVHQVIRFELERAERFTSEVADPGILLVVERRDLTSGRFEPEIVPRQVGTTQVALIGSSPSDSVGFRVIVTP